MNNHSDDDIFYRSPSFWDFKRLISISVLYPELLMESCKMVLTFDSVAEIPKPAKTSVSPRSSPLGTLRAEERRSSARNVPSAEERGETDVFAG